jgi:hypothetical protein
VAAAVSPESSLRPRAGRRFEPVAEAALEGDALNAVRALPHAHRGLKVLREVAGPFGVPDFVAVVGTQDGLAARIALSVPPLLNEVDAGIVAVLSTRRGRTIDAIAASVGWSSQTIARRLPALVRSTAVSEVGRDGYVRAAGLQPIGRIYAVETKVSDWRRAVRQARTYRLWCDNYVIVMASLSESTMPLAVDAIGSDGGGLMSGGRWVRRIRSHHLPMTRRLWGSEHVVAALGGPSPAFGSSELS